MDALCPLPPRGLVDHVRAAHGAQDATHRLVPRRDNKSEEASFHRPNRHEVEKRNDVHYKYSTSFGDAEDRLFTAFKAFLDGV